MIAIRLTAIVFAAALAVAPSIGCAHRPPSGAAPVWELRGAIVDVIGDRVRVRHKTGQIVDLILDDRTVVLHDERPEGRDALRRGRRVRVEVEPLGAEGARARVVRVYSGGS